ncbi:MAG TPA: AAA family ATPase [Candidatus Paceibacterota bacterium]|nr:AAA family ATPase [Candidatus Paceibacterota bacterium]
MIALVNQGLGGCHPLRADYRPTGALEPEQEQALQLILRSPDEVIALQGRAGAGKTQLLQELVRAIDQRYASTVLAPAAAAVDVLRPQGFKQAATVQSFLVDPEFQRSTRGQALVVDEAGVLSLHDLHRTHSRAEERPFGLRGHDSTATRV